MKIPRKKKNDRTAFFHMSRNDYGKFRLLTNPERRLDRSLPPATLQARDRARSAKFRKELKESTPLPLDRVPGLGGTLWPIHTP